MRQEAIKQAEKERRDKYKKQEEEREVLRQGIRDKVRWINRHSEREEIAERERDCVFSGFRVCVCVFEREIEIEREREREREIQTDREIFFIILNTFGDESCSNKVGVPYQNVIQSFFKYYSIFFSKYNLILLQNII